MCSLVTFTGSLDYINQIQTPPTTLRNADNYSNNTNLPPACEHGNIFEDVHVYFSHKIKYSVEAYCNVSGLNEETGFVLKIPTILLVIHCHGENQSFLWNGMFYNRWMHTIRIENCLLASISGKTFSGVSSLKNLIIEGGYRVSTDLCNRTIATNSWDKTDGGEPVCSRYLRFPPRIFSPLRNLEQLTLNTLKLNNSIWEEIKELRNLTELSMHDNDISILDKSIMSELRQLENLDLSNNNIQTIEKGSFKSQTKIYLMNLSQNEIHDIEHDAFEGLKNLQNLNLRGNKLTKLNGSMFKRLGNLKQLDLAVNGISEIEANAFIGMQNILSMTLDTNRVEEIQKDTFGHLLLLQELHLSNNEIKVVPSDTFMPKGNLKLIDISHNNISTIEYDDQSSPLSSTLEKLIMHNNNMTSMAWLTNSVFPALEALDISQNRVSGRMSNVAWPKTLAEVNASGNDIEHLTIVMPHGYGKEIGLKLLDASRNQITDIAIGPDSKSTQGVHISLYLGNNPFHCDCKLVWLKQLVTSQSSSITSSYVILDPDNLYCETLVRNKPGQMKDINPENFLCEYNESCPETCTCYKGELSSGINIVDCKGNNMTAISTEIPADCTMLDLSGNVIDTVETGIFDRLTYLGELFMNSSQLAKIEAGAFRNLGYLVKLDLANNKLKTVDTEIFEGLGRLKILDLGINKIHHIREGSLKPLKALRQLNLRSNQLITLSESEFQFLSQLESVKLAENPWSCDCAFVEMMKVFMSENTKRIHDIGNIACERFEEEPRKRVQHLLLKTDKSKFCINDEAADNSLIIALIAILSVLVIGLLALIWAFKYRKFLVIWCFVKFGRKCNRGNENDEDEDRHFDAFVSYSGLDCDFVAQELVPRLEEPGHGKVGYKLCVHDRDFPAGESTAETIIDVSGNSKRVIVVLSNNYLRSRWCKYEFEQAYCQLLQEGRNRIIMIVLEELDPDLIYTEIGNYMMTRTYLKYSDPMLWAKIQHAMPVAWTHKCVGNLNQDNDSDTVEFIEMGYM